jgi:hypothetical protein
MAIRWDEFPHYEIRLKIYARLGHNAIERSAEDSSRRILRRRLASLDPEDHRRLIELEARNLVEHLRCTRDLYQEFVERHNCRPILEAKWVVLRCAVFPTAIDILRGKVIEYARLTRIPGRDLSLLFGIPTRTCYTSVGDAIGLLCPPNLDDNTASTDKELLSLGGLVNEGSLLWFRDIRDGGAIGLPRGEGPFAIDNALTIRNSFALCGLRDQLTLPNWLPLRDKWWHQCSPWTDGLCNLFGSVQEELLSQWHALPPDSLAHELALNEKASDFKTIVVPAAAGQPKFYAKSKSYQTIVFLGREYSLTPQAGAILKVLHESGGKPVAKVDIQSMTKCGKISDSFRCLDGPQVWKNLIEATKGRKGFYRLNPKASSYSE